MGNLEIINPATNKVIKTVETDSPESIKTKFNRARDAQKKWALTEIDYRIEVIKKFTELVKTKKEKLALVLTSEVGKPITQSFNELNGLLQRLDFFIGHVKETLSDEVVLSDRSQNMEEKIVYEPLGVIANISAWNYPYFVGSNVFVPALLAGNSVLYKPSEFAILTGLEIANMLYESGVPEDVFIPVIGKGDVGSALLSLPLNGVFFTGSYATGKKIAEAVAPKMIKFQLELGGKDPLYVCDDVDVSSVAASAADGAFYNAGQSCCAVERIYVHENIYDDFVNSIVDTVKNFITGEPMDGNTYLGPLTRRELQTAHLEEQVADAVSKGAKVIFGGKRNEKMFNYFEPTVLVNVNHDMVIMKEETFGPLIGIQKVSNDDEAINLMNDTEYGLTASVYSKDKSRAVNILTKVNAGTTYWNCCDRVSPRLPWSGRRHSGIGCTLSTYGIKAFVQQKAWHLRG